MDPPAIAQSCRIRCAVMTASKLCIAGFPAFYSSFHARVMNAVDVGGQSFTAQSTHCKSACIYGNYLRLSDWLACLLSLQLWVASPQPPPFFIERHEESQNIQLRMLAAVLGQLVATTLQASQRNQVTLGAVDDTVLPGCLPPV